MARLLVDAMCGRLPPYLRLCGHDTVYAPDRGIEDDDAVLAVADAEDRTILTRDRELSDRAERAVLLRSRGTDAQLAELAAAGIELSPTETPQQCGRCNGPVEAVSGAEPGLPQYVPDELPRDEEGATLWRCRSCGQYFWKGGHWERMTETLDGVR
ncbi:Mut7-C RNAse domain-containing protein [Natranaeroarchaeum aerophilus]|uniref:Mut7-C RNAse domain-containing protein n=1 Tax=Natranaeroarchaeum aerophilus TaxID=2917711 RepID=A0AAE3FTC7_9EURY|nr:DUF5615 family PIN-like protein [Natranaeroarchaeum aerophilus]MCL9814791.1 Mut7-C RNAse domain-containing protein [Natranaeroarchaeum aerophilus]